jgi:hypothetical protein
LVLARAIELRDEHGEAPKADPRSLPLGEVVPAALDRPVDPARISLLCRCRRGCRARRRAKRTLTGVSSGGHWKRGSRLAVLRRAGIRCRTTAFASRPISSRPKSQTTSVSPRRTSLRTSASGQKGPRSPLSSAAAPRMSLVHACTAVALALHHLRVDLDPLLARGGDQNCPVLLGCVADLEDIRSWQAVDDPGRGGRDDVAAGVDVDVGECQLVAVACEDGRRVAEHHVRGLAR